MFASAKAAIDRNDLRTFCECLSLEARDDYVALSVFIAAHMKQGIAILDGQQKAAMVSEQLDALKKKHGLDKAKSLHAAVSLTVNDEVQDEAMREVIVAIKDRNGFIADVDALGRQIDKTEQGKRLLTEDARLDDVKIEGDRATARLLETRDGDVNTESIEFQKIEGRWKIAAMPGISF